MPVMGKRFQITIDEIDLGQILDGLRARQESWANTATYMRTGYSPGDAPCEECCDEYEAQRIADHYARIIRQIEEQATAKNVV